MILMIKFNEIIFHTRFRPTFDLLAQRNCKICLSSNNGLEEFHWIFRQDLFFLYEIAGDYRKRIQVSLFFGPNSFKLS